MVATKKTRTSCAAIWARSPIEGLTASCTDSLADCAEFFNESLASSTCWPTVYSHSVVAP